ncbi:hypothetical protein C8Q80DRAFT_1123442 [Daedaleopsis nitida]|nr:hypothetical protein C8Q80DRAFT_1123442 [Daedaleopsis nitida]
MPEHRAMLPCSACTQCCGCLTTSSHQFGIDDRVRNLRHCFSTQPAAYIWACQGYLLDDEAVSAFVALRTAWQKRQASGNGYEERGLLHQAIPWERYQCTGLSNLTSQPEDGIVPPATQQRLATAFNLYYDLLVELELAYQVGR